MGPQTFGRAQRLSESSEFRRLVQEGRTIRRGWWTLKALPTRRAGRRFGCTVRRAADTRSVVRNRLKRWFREAFRRNQERLPEGWAFLAIVSRIEAGVGYSSVEEELLHACESLTHRPGSSG